MIEFLLSCIILSLKVALGSFLISLGVGLIGIILTIIFTSGGSKFGSGG